MDITNPGTSGCSACRSLMSSRPLLPPSEMSTMARSGFNKSISFIASLASPASAQTIRSSCWLMSCARPCRIIGWSSTSSTFFFRRARAAVSSLAWFRRVPSNGRRLSLPRPSRLANILGGICSQRLHTGDRILTPRNSQPSALAANRRQKFPLPDAAGPQAIRRQFRRGIA